MAEQAINTIYLLGEQPDGLCGEIIKNLTARVFSAPSSSTAPDVSGEADTDAEGGETADEAGEGDVTATLSPSKTATLLSPTKTATISGSPAKTVHSRAGSPGNDTAGSFALAQLLFVVGHTAIKHIVYLELVEREFKRRKDETAKRESCGWLCPEAVSASTRLGSPWL
jgi:condensin complex subunit 1